MGASRRFRKDKAMTDTIGTSTEGVETITAKLRADANSLRVIAANATIAPETFTDAAKEKDDIAALLDTLAKERDGWKHYFEIARDKLVAEYDRAESAEREIIALRRERDEVRRMLAEADAVIERHVVGMARDSGDAAEAIARHRAGQLQREEKTK